MTNLKTCLLILLLLASVTNAQTLSEKIDAYLTRLSGFGLTGSVLVAQDGKVILEKGYGMAHRARQLPFTKDTVVDIGSNTKDLTKTAILQLAQNGKLKLTDTLPRFLENVPTDKAAITVEQLLNHTAGFGQYSGRDNELATKEQFLKNTLSTPLIASPGQEENYSNPGYSLLAAIIEKVSSKSYDQYVQENILTPAGMTTTGYILPKWREGQLARNYADGEELPSTFDYPHPADGPTWNLRGNGGMLSTVGDMYKFYSALRGDKLLALEFKAKLFDLNSPVVLVGGNGIHFFVFHNEPSQRLVILAGTTDPRIRAMEISNRIAALASGREPVMPPLLTKLDSAALQKFAGQYKLPSGAELTAVTKGDALFVTGTNEAGFAALRGTPRGNPERLAKLGEQTKALLEAAAKGAHDLTHKAFGDAMPYEQFKARQEQLWRQRRERLGAFKTVTILGAAPQPGNTAIIARVEFERGADYAEFIWDMGGRLRAWRPAMMTPPGSTFYPQTATEFVNFNHVTGESVQLRFQPQGTGYSISLQSQAPPSHPATTSAPTGTPKLPDNAVGRVIAAYLKAFNSGDDKVMQEFLEASLSKASLASRPMKDRLEVYHRLRDDLGNLTISEIAAPNETAVNVTFQSAKGPAPIFMFEMDTSEPNKLKGLRIELR